MAGFRKHLTAANLICGGLCLLYTYLFTKSLSPYWFSPKWTTDDALQQAFPFHAVHHPHIFEGDLLYNAMKGYLPPLHRLIAGAITWFSADPIMTGHWVMLLQISLAVIFVFLAVQSMTCAAPAFLAVTWLLHTRHTIQRLTGGLPRGWALPLLAACVFLLLKKKYVALLALLYIGCLLHPPATFVCALSFGFVLVWESLWRETRKQALQTLLILLLLTPLYLGTLYFATKRPAYMGDVVTYAQAEKMPEFKNPGGRFPFVPMPDPWTEMRFFGFQPFFHPIYTPGMRWASGYIKLKSWKKCLSLGLPILFLILLWLGYRHKKELVPAALLSLAAAALLCYAAARIFAFKLFVPDRYLQYPFTIFWVSACTIMLWRLFHRVGAPSRHLINYQDSSWGSSRPCFMAYAVLAALILIGGGTGLYGSANFNYSKDQYGQVFRWISSKTPPDSYFAGHPKHIDGLPLFGVRRAFATTETTHPFFPVYLKEMMRRLEISLRAHYAQELSEIVALLKPEGINYFVFSVPKFSAKALKKETFFTPLDTLVRELTSRPAHQYAFRKLPAKLDMSNHPYMVFKDAYSVVIDIPALEKHLKHKREP